MTKTEKISVNFDNFLNYYLVNAIKGKKGVQSSQIPFFNIHRDNNELEKINLKKRDLNPNIPNSLNRNIKEIYRYFESDDEELYLSDWIFLSIDEAIDRYKIICENKREDVFDIAYRYLGMGHINVLACDLNSNLLFLRPDGGSNGYDRDDNFSNLIKNGSTPYPKINFTQWINNFSESIYD